MFLTSICILLNRIHCMTSFAVLIIIKKFPRVVSNLKVLWTSIKNFLCYFKTSIKYASNLDSLKKVLKSINRDAKTDQLAKEEDSITLSLATSTILVCHHNSQYSVVASANVVHKAEGLPGSLKLAMKLHYFANIKYPDSVKPLYGVLEAFSKLPISVSLGALAKKVIAENK